MRGTLTCLAVALTTCGAALAASPVPSIDLAVPPAAIPSTARLTIQDGAGARHIALWTATNARNGLCTGFRTGASPARPARFTCLRRGLEQPLLTGETGGGLGGIATWGIVVGIAGPSVARVEANTLYGTSSSAALALHPIPGLPGWHSFTTHTLDHPTSTKVDAYDASGALIAESSGASIHPTANRGPGPITITPPGVPPTGASWSDSASNLPSFGAGVQAEISLALNDPRVRTILNLRGGWLDDVSLWTNCSGRSLGHVITFRFPAAVSFVATLPSVGPPSGNVSYAVTTRKVAATDWRNMTVWVDSTTRTVVGIDSAGTALPGQPDGQTVPLAIVSPPEDAGGSDPAGSSCWQSTG